MYSAFIIYFCGICTISDFFILQLFRMERRANKTFIGIENYITLLKDSTFWNAFGHNIYLVILCVIGQVGIAFVFVMIISTRFVKMKGIHRTFGFFPSTVSAVAVGFIWTMIYDNRRGILNWFLDLIGQEDKKQVWLNNPDIVMTLVAIPLIWQFIGYYMVILLSATSAIDKEILESAELDGASAVQRALYVVIPMIKNTIAVCIVLCVSGNMKAFDNIYVMTAGGITEMPLWLWQCMATQYPLSSRIWDTEVQFLSVFLYWECWLSGLCSSSRERSTGKRSDEACVEIVMV